MTAQNENGQEAEENSRLARLLGTVKSIDKNVEEIREKLDEAFDSDGYEDDLDEYLDGNDY